MTNYNPYQITKPAQDSADNVFIQDVVGNKTDTTSGDSIVSLIKTTDLVTDVIKSVTDNLPDSGALTSIAQASALATVDGYHDVPTADSANNLQMRDVIGNKTDTESGNSLYSKNLRIEEHIHSPCKVYPSLAAGVTVTCGTPAWTLGAFATIVPVNTITSLFDIHWISLENISTAAVYELIIYYGATDIEAGRVRFTKTVTQDPTFNIPMQTIIIPANSQIRAKVASSGAAANTVDISIFYHTY